MPHRPPKNDRERLQNLIEALAEPTDGDDAFDEAMRADLARRGLTLETWAAQCQARAQEVLDRSRRARRTRALKIAAAGTAGLAVAAGAALALQSVRIPRGEVGAPMTMKAPVPMLAPDAGVDASRRK